VLGALALVAVLAQVAVAIGNVVTAFGQMSLASRKTSDQEILDGERVIKAKASVFSASGVARLLDQGNFGPKTIEVQSASTTLKDIEDQKKILAARNAVNDAGLQGLALQKARVAGVQAEIDLNGKTITSLTALKAAYLKQLEGTHDVTGFQDNGAGGGFETHDQKLNITDPTQVKALQAQLKTANDALKEAGVSATVLGLNLEAAEKKEPLAAIKDAAKAAAAEMKRLNDELNRTKTNSKGFVTAQDTFDFYQKNRNNLPGNQDFADAIDSKTGAAKQQINQQNETVITTVAGLNAQVAAVVSYGDARKIQLAVEKEVAALEKQHIEVGPQLIAYLTEANTAIVTLATYQKELNAAYEGARGPLQTYEAAQQAISTLMREDPAHIQQYTEFLFKAGETYKDATIPLYQYSKGIEDQTTLLFKYGTELANAQLKLKLIKELEAKGIDSGSAVGQAALASGLTAGSDLRRAQTLSQGVGAFNDTDQTKKLADDTLALNTAWAQGKVYGAEYATTLGKIQLAQANLAIKMGDTSPFLKVKDALLNLKKDYEGFNVGASKALNNFYETLDNGFADSVGRAIVYSQDFGKSLEDVARQAVAGLISALVKLGIEWAIAAAFGTAGQTSQIATAVATGSAIAAAYAPAAALASLASFGGNAIGADLALTTTTGLANALSIAHFAGGGRVYGSGHDTSDTVPAMLSPGEYVINAQATRDNYGVIDAINRGAKIGKYSMGGYIGTQPQAISTGMKVSIEDHTAGLSWETNQIGPNEVQVIARREAATAVKQQTPNLMAAHLRDPNSPASKALAQHTTVKRVRS
jgi:hypothetical protein